MTTTMPRSPEEAAALLAAAVRTALGEMIDMRQPAPTVVDGRIENALREALGHQPPTPRDPQSPTALASAAARAACAHLSVKAWTEARQALLVAQDHLGGPPAGRR